MADGGLVWLYQLPQMSPPTRQLLTIVCAQGPTDGAPPALMLRIIGRPVALSAARHVLAIAAAPDAE